MKCKPPVSLHTFPRTLLSLAAAAALLPQGAMALDLSQSPPGTKEPYVSPNVIISIDDSGSMNFRLDSESTSGASNQTTPNSDGTWPMSSRRVNVLKYALIGNNGSGGIFRDTTLLPDKKIRLAWQAMWNNGRSSDAGNVDSGSGRSAVQMNTNSMRPLQGSHRTNFISFINNLSPNNGTPSHLMFSQADSYMRRAVSKDGPWASDPGNTGAPYLACRRNYHIMMTDGRWNGTATSVPNTNWRDNATNLKFNDNMVYGGSTADQKKSALYRDESKGTTLADWAFYSWANPLQTSGLTGTMQPTADYRKASSTETFTSASGTSATLDRYWNPRYNPATWPHMVTYTIGFSKMAFEWSYSSITRPTQMVPFGYDGSFPGLANGTIGWPDLTASTESRNALDLWHAALNGRGRFYAVEKGEDLEKAFREIFGQINTQTEPDLTSTATSGSNASRNDVGKFTGAYEPQNAWKGFVTAETVQKDGTTVSAPGWGGKNTADKLDALTSVASRLILSWSDKWDTTKYKGGTSFKWANDEANLSTAQKAMLGLNPSDTSVTVATNGQNRLNFIRGDRSLEGSDNNGYTTSQPFRERKSRQGDIINSVVWYLGKPSSSYALTGYAEFTRNNADRPAMIYVGGNDGMLHGFSAADGSEKIAYVPRGVIPNLKLLTSPDYNSTHKYFVDGSPMTGDVDLGTGIQATDDPNYAINYTAKWRTLLVGALGAGGKGYFVLDVTNPNSASTTDGALGFTEANASQLVKLDRTRGAGETVLDCARTGIGVSEKAACLKAVEEDRDIGHITARPVLDENDPMRTTQITRMNNNRWAVVMGNGYNSANQRPVLLVQYLDGAQELVRIPVTTETAGTGKAADNGLSAPRLVDIDGDGRPDVIYAGDNLGNLWKFDVTSINDSNWNVAFRGQPLFTAKGPTALNSSARTNVQPITVAPTVRTNDRTMTIGTGTNAKTVPVTGMMIAFGTGRNVTQDDPNSVQVQSLYSVLDNTRYRIIDTTKGKRLEVHPGDGVCAPSATTCVPSPLALGEGVANAKLAEQKISELGNGEYGTVDARNAENELKKETWANYNGWFMDMPAIGERLLKPMEFYDGSNILTMYTQVPAKGSNVDLSVESCESTSVDEERQYRTLINIMDGKRPTVQIVDKNKDGFFNVNDGGVSRAQVSKGSHTVLSSSKINIDIDSKNEKEKLAPMPEESLRPSWRHIK
ncbi:PilC/PilY family type IV pilus protein [Delftia acidovorans]|uniref:pilus assembly protein n=1 Tax=Delftia acidovorans TaxID=80866 RepID=UPI0028E8C8FA|nr:PilC/PilY family type IV pilus protein [Delftia acidovorans]